jgi:hypothetical protein
MQISLGSIMSVIFDERLITRLEPEKALIDEPWVLASATELGRVFLHLEMKLVRHFVCLPFRSS